MIYSYVCGLLINCTSSTQEKESFDYPLLQKSEVLRLAGKYEQTLNLNREYLHTAQKKVISLQQIYCFVPSSGLTSVPSRLPPTCLLNTNLPNKKYRLRKKLNILTEEDFLVFFQKLENNEEHKNDME